MEEKKGMIQRKVAQIRGSLTFKLAAIAFVVLVLLIPIFTIQSLIYERKNRQEEVLREVGATWGGDQYLVGPVLTIPYSTWREKDDGTKTEEKHFAHFLPDELYVSGNLAHEIRRKSIYDVILFQGDLLLSGKFEHPDFSSFFVPEQDVHWEAAGLSFGISGMNGIKELSPLSWDGDTLRPGPGTVYPRLIPSGVSVQLPLRPGGTAHNFELKIKLNGQGSFSVEPVGRVTKLSLSSDWPSPGFSGAFLPDSHHISKDGFTAEWQVPDLNRNYPQQWSDDEYNSFGGRGRMAFGVRLVQPVDEYLKNTRSAKYAVLVVGLTFLIFFFFEVLHKLLIHPFQYFLIGIALAVFYLILLSFSEHIGFNRAYLVATVATISLISGYGWAILKYKKLVLQLTIFLVTIYGFIYIILQLEDYALLAGTVGVIAAVALAMYYSRNIDWYNLGDSEVSEN